MRSQGEAIRERSREARETSGIVADGELVWSWHPLLMLSGRGGTLSPTGRARVKGITRARSRGEKANVCVGVIPGRIEDANPESRDSGFDAAHRPGMTASKKCVATDAMNTIRINERRSAVIVHHRRRGRAARRQLYDSDSLLMTEPDIEDR
jgi:hypothetical protein